MTSAFASRVCGALALPPLIVALAQPAQAAGFDTPVQYSARHQGMGGTAIGYVDDPSAAFHNPAGLRGVQGLALLADVSMLLVHATGSPAVSASASGIQSNLSIVPMFMAAAGYRVSRWLSAGLAVYPVAAGGAEYEYPAPGNTQQYQINSTSFAFYELTPLISLNVPQGAILPGELSFGVGYRMSLFDFERVQGARDNPQALDLELRGRDYTGVRLGLQYRPLPALSLGAVYRNRVDITARADEGTLLANVATDLELPVVLPAQLGGGVRVDVDRLGLAFDATYSFQSQNDRTALSGSIAGNRVSIPSVSDWQDAFTLRFGFEYRLGPGEELPIRVGYVHDGQVSSRAYPSPFGMPPVATHTFTLGGGYDAGAWEMNLALALSGGSTQIEPDELAPPAECPTCGAAGEYGVAGTGLYVDFSTDIAL